MTKKIHVLSHKGFDDEMKALGIDDSNVENERDKAFISIIGTEECLKYYLNEETTQHYFSDDHPNVLNLDFDDVGDDDYVWEGHVFHGLSDEQANRLLSFIGDNLKDGAKDFYIHCRAGVSRSAAVGVFIHDMYPHLYKGEDTLDMKYPRNYLNQGVLTKLKRVWYKKYGIINENCSET